MDASLTPEFALEAAEHLAASRALEAARLSAAGIERYPTYPGGYVMLARAYAALGRNEDAQTMLRDISERFPYVTASIQPVVEMIEAAINDVEVNVSAPESEDVQPDDATDLLPETEIVELSLPDEPEAIHDVTADQTAAEYELVEDAEQPPSQVLRMIESVPVDGETRIIRSASVRLIPGLEFTTLRVEGLRSRGRRGIGVLPEPPAFRSFHRVRRPQRAPEPQPARKPVSLEELAARLSDVKMPRQSELDAMQQPPAPPVTAAAQPIMVTDTIAQIYMQQQSYDLAIEAFKTLIGRKPDRKDHYEALIRECERKRG